MTTIGKVTEFRPDGNWEEFRERFEFYLELNNITEEKKKKCTLYDECGRRDLLADKIFVFTYLSQRCYLSNNYWKM